MPKTVIVVRDEATLYDVATSHPTPKGEPVEIVLDRRVGPRHRRARPVGGTSVAGRIVA